MIGFLLLTGDSSVAEAAQSAARSVGGTVVVTNSLGELIDGASKLAWSVLVIDRDHSDAELAAEQFAVVAAERRVVCVVCDLTAAVLPNAHLVVLAPALKRTLVELASHRAVSVPSSVERLMEASVLDSTVDDAIDEAGHKIAVAFGVARCLISARSALSGLDLSEGATYDAEAWSVESKCCRAAMSMNATLVVPAYREPTSCDSYLAVNLETARGESGFIGLIATGARVYSSDERATLRAVAARIGRELRWRAVHDRTSDELERRISGPGLDPLLGIWNRPALDQIAHAYVSNAKRMMHPLAVLAVRAVDLEGINTRYGLAMGDRFLRRTADALKPALRGEDIVGRYSGTVLVVILQNAGTDEATRVAERVHAMLADRSLEVAGDMPLKIATTIGLTTLHEREEATNLLRRTVHGAKVAPDNVIVSLSTPTTFTGRVPLPTDSSELQMQATFGGSYRLRHEISRGGMGVVYRADDLALERPVAIKMLRPELAQNAELVKHLRREAALLARVHHTNLVQIYNFGQTEGDCYFVMELVEGESLQQAIERHHAENVQMPVLDVLAITDQIASALDALHERGIVHRDVKPANFIRDPFTGRSVLVDVGIAHRFGELSAKQAGTPGFMAPEVIQGVAASPRTDVYGLAASVFAMLTLAAPWGEGEPIDILMRQCTELPLRASSLRPELQPIDSLLEDALSFDAERRPASAGELARALVRVLGTIVPVSWPRPANGRVRAEHGNSAPRTRGVVFRSALRALAVREADCLRDALGNEHAELANVLAQCAPLAWVPTELFVRLLEIAPQHVSRGATALARDIARETVRTSFRTFFPASPATLHPERTLSAIRGVWSRYHTWGNISPIPVSSREMVVRLNNTLQVKAMCDWTSELLNILVLLSGGRDTAVNHESCELDGGAQCAFRVTWND